MLCRFWGTFCTLLCVQGLNSSHTTHRAQNTYRSVASGARGELLKTRIIVITFDGQ